ncbi:hypothetical protein N7468_008382 [Penicillium chermesinum]|uniref:Bromo domain-containing protein n=1 Tax=Penicillium chermesinum TaxID=63820 RepID=A0A9W9NPM7_9EURO|nr:uncharacterized protein N7468_008382 [Penicillium chermesinum]KAJ5223840.1 hypothetical protein N7468_008382 [Penicillium chermesinum]
MPPLSAYTPFESLLFFQSLAASDVRPSNFSSISTSLRNNPLIRDNVAFSADRLTPEALEDLYTTLLRDGLDREAAAGPNGRPHDVSSPSNAKKRKISSPKPEGLPEDITHAIRIPELVSHLYSRFRETLIKEVRQEERKYNEIKKELDRLEKDESKATSEALKRPDDAFVGEPMEVDVKQETRPERPAALASEEPQKPADETFRKETTSFQAPKDAPQPPTKPAEQPAEPSQAQPPIQHEPPSKAAAQPAAPAHPPLAPRTQPPAPATPIAARPPRTPHPSQLAPRPIAASTPIGQPGAPTLDAAPHSPYSAISPNTAAPPAGSAAAKQALPPVQAAAQKPSAPSTVPSTPSAVSSSAQTGVPIGPPQTGSRTPSVVIPPYSESRSSRPRLDTPGSSTPWRKLPRLSIPQSPPSPARPQAVSPISDRETSPGAMDISPPRERKSRRGQNVSDSKSGPAIKTEKSDKPEKIEKAPAARRKRAFSSVSSHSHAQSVQSHDTSPAPPDDTDRDLRTSGRRNRAATGTDEKARSKRKRGASESTEHEPVHLEPKFDTTKFVLCARGFHRTAAPILNDVTTHKLASIFAKPLSERDAPGYHDLIYRPQDLKSIKAAVHAGSKAVIAATEAVSTPAGDGESPVPTGTPSSKHNLLMLPKTEDLVPPKGIVNSAQLEKEFTRMFANAIMFNPVPERGLGPAFAMVNDRGSRESTQSGDDGEEGGIIQDAREMFEDVEQAVTRWRAAERTTDELAIKSVFSLRRGSASDFNTDSADDGKG